MLNNIRKQLKEKLEDKLWRLTRIKRLINQ
jgi:hypothetical protein